MCLWRRWIHLLLMDDKNAWRRRLLDARERLPDRDRRSAAIRSHLEKLEQYRTAASVLCYVGVKSEVATAELVADRLSEGLVTAVVAVSDGELLAVRIERMSELAPASFGLLEPAEAVRSDPARILDPASVDAMLIPGVGFDHDGWRLGYGKGYYDRLLRRAGPQPARLALAFGVQVVAALPHGPSDEPIHWLVTESGATQPKAGQAN